MSHEYSIEASHTMRSALSLLRPHDVAEYEKVRVGRPFDGGYVMMDAFDEVEGAYSFGINDDVSWDIDIANRDIKIYQYDHTIDSLPMDHPMFSWKKLGIAPFSDGNMISISDIIRKNGHKDSKNLLLKCDIECAEWEALRYTKKEDLLKFSQIVIEIHDVYRLGDPNDVGVKQALSNLTNSHKVIHVHANNYGGFRIMGGICLPNVLELTLLRKDMGTFSPSNTSFPTPMDMPCNRDSADLFLGNFVF